MGVTKPSTSIYFLQVIPILKLLYTAEEQNSHHIYMALIVLLILSQDDNFNKSVHEVVSIAGFPARYRVAFCGRYQA